MVRIRIAAGIAAVAAFAAFPAVAQTVGDYQEALRNVPGAEATPAKIADACKTVANYAAVAIPGTGNAVDSLISTLTFAPPTTDATEQKRTACAEARAQAIVSFDDKSGTSILTPPVLEDPEKAFMSTMPVLPDFLPSSGLPAGSAINKGQY